MKLVNGLRLDNLRGDMFGGVTAAVVALPLALAFGVASGAGPMAGLYGAIFVGFFASLFGGTPSQISGPTGPMTVVMAGLLTQYAHEPAMAFTVVVMGGGFQILFGALRFGGYISLVPYTVVSGFMSGIGCIIIILQVAPLLGEPTPGGGTVAVLMAMPDILANIHADALAVGLGSLAIMYLAPKRLTRIVPGALIALVAGTLVVWLVLPGVPVLGDIPTGFPEPQLPTFSVAALPGMVGSALILALLGSIDSLLTSLVADNMTRTQHQSDRELIGQGIGNMFAGLFGAIPGAGATMRTVVNVRAGGATPISGVLHALALAAIVLGLGPLAGQIPHAVLAGILFRVGIDIIDWAFIRRAPRAPRTAVAIMLTVLGLTVFVDLIVAVATGIVAASLVFVKRMADLELANIKDAEGQARDPSGDFGMTPDERALLGVHAGDILLYRFSGPLSFGAAKGMTRRVVVQASYKVLVLDLTAVTYADTSSALAVEDIINRAHDLGLAVIVVGLGDAVRDIFARLGILRSVLAERQCGSLMEALSLAVRLSAGADIASREAQEH